MIARVLKFKTGQVAKVAHMIERHDGEINFGWHPQLSWSVIIEIAGRELHIHDPGEVYRLYEFMRRRSAANTGRFLDTCRGLEAAAEELARKIIAKEVPPAILTVLHPQGSA